MTLDPLTFGDNTELVLTTQTVIPTRGAVARARYKTNIGYRALMTLVKPGGQEIPFGAIISGSDSEGAIVGDAGHVYITGLAPQGQLQVKWGNTPDAQCKVRYSLPQNPEGIVNMNAQCD